MLQLSESAAAALETIRANEGVPESHDTRLSAEPQPSGEVAIRLEFVEGVGADDQVTEQGDTQVFVDSQIADQLSDSVLDVRQTEEGLAFVFVPQV